LEEEDFTMRTMAFILALSATMLFAGENEDKRLRASAEVLNDIMKSPDRSIPQDLLQKAHCAVIIPGMKKGGFIVGAKYGRGFASCRLPGGKGWSAPHAMRAEGGSFGFQIGGAESDLIFLIMSERGMKGLLSSKFTLGGEATAAAGPVGRDTQAQTDATMRAEILTWSRSRGVFGGIALQGATLRADTDVNTILYGNMTPEDILRGKAATPSAGKAIVQSLNKYSGRAGK
jgi:SH3 domain-containing YSC84-like protein 1